MGARASSAAAVHTLQQELHHGAHQSYHGRERHHYEDVREEEPRESQQVVVDRARKNQRADRAIFLELSEVIRSQQRPY